MSNMNINKLLFKIITWPMAIIFLCQNITWAEPRVNNGLQNMNFETKSSIFIPEQYGKIENLIHNSSFNIQNLSTRPVVVLIKDAHCNYEAQTNIVKILDTLICDYKIDLVCVEGASGKIEADVFQSMPDNKAREKACDKFMKNGYLSASEVLSISRGDKLPFSIWGVEDTGLYFEDLKLFRQTISNSNEAMRFVEIGLQTLEILKDKIYNSRLKEFDNKYKQYERNEASLTDWIKYLWQQIKLNFKGRPRDTKNLCLILKAVILEEKIDFKKVEDDRNAVIKKLENTLPEEDLKILVEKSLLFKLGKVSPAAYYNYLGQYLKDLRGICSFNNLKNYIRLVNLQNKIDEDGLFKELDRIKDMAMKNLSEKELELKLYEIETKLMLLNKLFNLQINRDNLEYYEKIRYEFSIKDIADFLIIQSRSNGITPPGELSDNELLIKVQENMRLPEEFYRLAKERDGVLVENLLQKMDKEGKQKAVIIAGGFHSEGIKNKLDTMDIGCIVVNPKITKVEKDNPYLKLIMDKNLDIGTTLNEKIALPLLLWVRVNKDAQKLHELARLIFSNSNKTIEELEREIGPDKRDSFKELVRLAGFSKESKVEELGKIMHPDVVVKCLISLKDSQIDKDERDVVIDYLLLLLELSSSIVDGDKGFRDRLRALLKTEDISEFVRDRVMMRYTEILSKGEPILAHAEGMRLENPGVISKAGINDINKIKEAVKKDAVKLTIGDTAVFIDNDLLNQYNAFGFKSKEKFLQFLEKFLTSQIHLYHPANRELIISVIDTSECLFEDHICNGFIGIHRSLFEKLGSFPKTAQKLLLIGLRHELSHEAFFVERLVLVDYFQAKGMDFTAAVKETEKFIETNRENLKNKLQEMKLWDEVEARMLEKDLQYAEKMALDMDQVVKNGVLPKTSAFVNRYMAEGRSAFNDQLKDHLETQDNKFGILPEDHKVYQEINGIFMKILKAAGLEDEGIRLYMVNSDEVNAYWITDSRAFFINLGLIRTLGKYLNEKGMALTSDMVAFIIAHEIGHFVQYFEEKDVIAGVETRDRQTVEQNREYDADNKALYFTAYAGFNPSAGVEVFRFLDALGGIPFVGSHPKADLRIGEINRILKSPDQFIPNTNKTQQAFSDNFLENELIKSGTKNSLFHENMLDAKNLEEMTSQLDDISDPALFEEFLIHYHFRMLYDFSSGVMEDPEFQSYISSIFVVNNILAFIEYWESRSNMRQITRIDFGRKLGIPVTLSNLFSFYLQKGEGGKYPPISALGSAPHLPRDKIKEFIDKKIDTVISSLESKVDKDSMQQAVIPVMRILKARIDSLLTDADRRPVSRATRAVPVKNGFWVNKEYPSRAEAEREIGAEWILKVAERPDGSVLVTYIDRNALLENFEYLWDLFAEYDSNFNQIADDYRTRALQIQMLGIREWLKKPYGKLELPVKYYNLTTHLFGDFESDDQEGIERGRGEFLPSYLRFLAFHFLNEKAGPFGSPCPGRFPTIPNIESIRKKAIELTRRQFPGQSSDDKLIELLSMIRYNSIFRSYSPDFDGEVTNLIGTLSSEQITTLLEIVSTSLPLYLSSMPQNISNMLEYNDYLNPLQLRFSSYYFNIVSQLLKRRIQSKNLGLKDMDNVLKIIQRFEFRFGNKIFETEGFKNLMNFIFSEFLKDKDKAVLDLFISVIGETERVEFKEILFKYLIEKYFIKEDYSGKLDALIRLFPVPGGFRNNLLEFIFKIVEYEKMNDLTKKGFLERILSLFETEKKGLSCIEEDNKLLHQRLSRDYMNLLKKDDTRFVNVIKQMINLGAVVTQFDLIVDNQKEWKTLSLNEAREIAGLIKDAKNGYEKYQFAIGSIALTKIRTGIPALLLTDSTSSGSYNVIGTDGFRKMIYPYQEAMDDKTDFKEYLSWFIGKREGKEWIFEGRSFDESISLVLELLPLSKERDTILKQLIEIFKPVDEQILPILKEFFVLEDKGEMADLEVGTGFMRTGRPPVTDEMIFGLFGLEELIGRLGPEEIDIDAIIESIRMHIPDEIVRIKEVTDGLTKLRQSITAHKDKMAKLKPNDRWPYMNSIKGEIVSFAHRYLINNNPHFDYFNIKNFGYSSDEKFIIAWEIYKRMKGYFNDPSVSLEDKIQKMMQIFPDRTHFRDNELEKLITMEESRATGKQISILVQALIFIGIWPEPYEILKVADLDFNELTPNQADELIRLYKRFIPFMTESTHQITLGRKIFELQKRFYPEIYQDFAKGLSEILLIFPKFSLTRDSVLNEFINLAVRNYKQLRQVRKYILEEQRLTTESEIVKDKKQDELWKTLSSFPSRKEKGDFIIWLLSKESPMPESMARLSGTNHVNFNSLRNIIFGMTKGERDKYFYDLLRGTNGLFEVDVFAQDEFNTLIDRILGDEEKIIAEIVKLKPKADITSLRTAFNGLKQKRSLKEISELFQVIKKEQGSGLKSIAQSVGLNIPTGLLEFLKGLDIQKLLGNISQMEEAISTIGNFKESVQQLQKLLSITGKLGVGRTLQKNLARLTDLAGGFTELKPIVNNMAEILKYFQGIDLTQIGQLAVRLSELQSNLSLLRSQAVPKKDIIEKVGREIKEITIDIGAMQQDIHNLTRVVHIINRIGLGKEWSAKLESLQTMLDKVEDSGLVEFVKNIQEMISKGIGGTTVSPLEFIRSVEGQVHDNYHLENFIDKLFSSIFQPGELGKGENTLRDVFKSVFLGYSAERRILLFNSLLSAFITPAEKRGGRAQKIRTLLEQMGIIGVKVGQYLSEQPQLLGNATDIQDELRELKKDAVRFHKRAIFQLLQEAGLLDRVRELRTCLGSASIKQVYEILLDDGSVVAGKFMRPAAEKFLDEDIHVLQKVLSMLNEKYPDTGIPATMLDDIKEIIFEELQFEKEADNSERFQRNLSARETTQRGKFTIKVPKVYSHSKHIILEENVKGITISDLILLKKAPESLAPKKIKEREELIRRLNEKFTDEERASFMAYDPKEIQKVLIEEFFHEVFGEGFFHADLHFGNAMITPNFEIYMIDLGSAGSIEKAETQALLTLLVAIDMGNPKWFFSLLNSFLEKKVKGNIDSKIKLQELVSSNLSLEDKLKGITRIIEEDNLGADQKLIIYLKALSAVSPMLDNMAQDEKKKLVTAYLETWSKLKFIVHSLRAKFSGKPKQQIGKQGKVKEIIEGSGRKYMVVVDPNNQDKILGKVEITKQDNQVLFTTLDSLRRIHKRHGKFLDAFIKVLKTRTPELYTFSTLLKDLFGYASSENLIALHNSLINSPVAKFHELAEYLIKIGILKIELRDRKLVITLNQFEYTVDLGGEAFTIAEKDMASAHYLLRALQREIFGKSDRELTILIKANQLLRDLGKIIEGLNGLGKIELEKVADRISAIINNINSGKQITEKDLDIQLVLDNSVISVDIKIEIAAKIARFVDSVVPEGYDRNKGIIVAAIEAELKKAIKDVLGKEVKADEEELISLMRKIAEKNNIAPDLISNIYDVINLGLHITVIDLKLDRFEVDPAYKKLIEKIASITGMDVRVIADAFAFGTAKGYVKARYGKNITKDDLDQRNANAKAYLKDGADIYRKLNYESIPEVSEDKFSDMSKIVGWLKEYYGIKGNTYVDLDMHRLEELGDVYNKVTILSKSKDSTASSFENNGRYYLSSYDAMRMDIDTKINQNIPEAIKQCKVPSAVAVNVNRFIDIKSIHKKADGTIEFIQSDIGLRHILDKVGENGYVILYGCGEKEALIRELINTAMPSVANKVILVAGKEPQKDNITEVNIDSFIKEIQKAALSHKISSENLVLNIPRDIAGEVASVKGSTIKTNQLKVVGVDDGSTLYADLLFGFMYAGINMFSNGALLDSEADILLNLLGIFGYSEDMIKAVREDLKRSLFITMKLIRIKDTLEEFQNRRITIEVAA
jgi:predicted unusual protein kinase regulating ubiquinone biosynthesis (AarF/ABC1/UbiB family)